MPDLQRKVEPGPDAGAPARAPSGRGPWQARHTLRAAGGPVLIVDVEADGERGYARLAGAFGPDAIAGLGRQLSALIGAGRRRLVVDFDRIQTVPPGCAGMLNRAAADVRAAGGTLTLTGLAATSIEGLRRAGLADSISPVAREDVGRGRRRA